MFKSEFRSISHNAKYVNVPGMFFSLHLFVLYLVTHLYLRCKSVVFLLKAITGNNSDVMFTCPAQCRPMSTLECGDLSPLSSLA